MTASLPGVFNVQQFTDSGAPASGFRLYTYTPGTTTHKVAYTDAAAATPHTYTSDGTGGQYIALDARGELPAPLFLTPGGYDIALKTAAGATVWKRFASGIGDWSATLLGTDASQGDALLTVKRTGATTATTQHLLNDTLGRDAALDFAAPTDGVASASTQIAAAFSAIGKDRLNLSAGTYAASGLTLSASFQHISGMGWSSDQTTYPGATLKKNANGVALKVSGLDASASLLHIDGVKASYTGDGLVLSGERGLLDHVSVVKAAGVGIRIGAASENGNLWIANRPIALGCGSHGMYVHHTGGPVDALFPAGAPDVNAGVMVGGDLRSNTGAGMVVENAIDNLFLGPAAQSNTGKGIVLKSGARGHVFVKPYCEANNGAAGARGDEFDIESGATGNIVLGLRMGQLGGSGLRDVNTHGKNLIVTYDAATGSVTHRSRFVLWNPFEDGSTEVCMDAHAGANADNIFSLRGSISGTSGGVWTLATKIDGGVLTNRLSVGATGLMALTNTAGFGIGKTTSDTTTPGIFLGDSGSAANTRSNFVGAGSASDTRFAFYNSNGLVGSVSTNGSATTYATSSDYRLKRDAAPADGAAALSAVMSWPIRSFVWRASGQTDIGVIAHELQAVKPAAVVGERDGAEMQGVDYSKLVPELVAAVQYLAARVAALESGT